MTNQDESHGNDSTAGEETNVKIKSILADLLEIDVGKVRDESNLEDLGVDSLLYLEFFEELNDLLKLELNSALVGRYLTKNPISTVGEMIDLVRLYQDKGEGYFRKQLEED